MSTLLDEIRNDPVLSDASEWDTLRKMQGIVKKAGKELVSYTRQFNVPIDQIDVKLAESTNAAGRRLFFPSTAFSDRSFIQPKYVAVLFAPKST